MKKLVVDASTSIKWFVPETHTDAAASLLDPEILLVTADQKLHGVIAASSLAAHVLWIEDVK